MNKPSTESGKLVSLLATLADTLHYMFCIFPALLLFRLVGQWLQFCFVVSFDISEFPMHSPFIDAVYRNNMHLDQ